MRKIGRSFTDQRGYSLPEMLIVVAIIGIVSLVTVPAFINLQKNNKIKTSAREFNTLVRAARQRAVTTNMQTKVGFETSDRAKITTCQDILAPCQRRYTLYQRPNPSTAVPNPAWVRVDDVSRPRQTDPIVWFDDTSSMDDVETDDERDIIFRTNGTVLFISNTVTERTIVLRAMADIPFNQYTVTLRTTGSLATVRSRF